MVVKMSSKHQVTIPKAIADAFSLKKGDVLEVTRKGNYIVMIPKEVVFEDKYPRDYLEAAEKALSRGNPAEEVAFEKGGSMTAALRKRMKKK
jgi:AbrB family looped-hinge helix DNA binding protein